MTFFLLITYSDRYLLNDNINFIKHYLTVLSIRFFSSHVFTIRLSSISLSRFPSIIVFVKTFLKS